MAGDFSKPTLSSTYANFITEIMALLTDMAKALDATGTGNVPSGAVRWNSALKRWEKYNGTAWSALTTQYAIDVDTVDGYHATPNAVANNLAVRDVNGDLAGNITGNALTATNADKVDGFHASQSALANNVAVRDGSGKLAGDILGNAPTATNATNSTNATNAANADKVDNFHASQSVVANNVAVRDASGNIPGNITGNAAYATSSGNADTLDGLHSSNFAVAASVYLQQKLTFAWMSTFEATTRRAGTYGITYLDAYGNYANYSNYSDSC